MNRRDTIGVLLAGSVGKFQLAINMKTAAALGLAVPKALLLGADRVIE